MQGFAPLDGNFLQDFLRAGPAAGGRSQRHLLGHVLGAQDGAGGGQAAHPETVGVGQFQPVRALDAGGVECPLMPHAETVRMMEWMDDLRAQFGVKYPDEIEKL